MFVQTFYVIRYLFIYLCMYEISGRYLLSEEGGYFPFVFEERG